MSSRPNQNLHEALVRLSAYYRGRGDRFRSETFRKAAAEVFKKEEKILSHNQLQGTSGIGEGVLRRVKEFLETGTLIELEVGEKKEENKQLKELLGVFGIGTKTAQKLLQEGVTGIEDLKEKVRRKEVKLTSSQKLGLKYYEDFKVRVPRREVVRYGDCILRAFRVLDPGNLGEVVGSYRRGAETSGDIDILISNLRGKNFLKDFLDLLNEINFFEHVISEGEVKFMGIYRSEFPKKAGTRRKIDIRYVPPSSWPTALLHSTGPDEFNVKMRNVALAKGMTLSEHGLYWYNLEKKEKGDRIKVGSEEEVFRVLGLEYLPPTQRKGENLKEVRRSPKRA